MIQNLKNNSLHIRPLSFPLPVPLANVLISLIRYIHSAFVYHHNPLFALYSIYVCLFLAQVTIVIIGECWFMPTVYVQGRRIMHYTYLCHTLHTHPQETYGYSDVITAPPLPHRYTHMQSTLDCMCECHRLQLSLMQSQGRSKSRASFKGGEGGGYPP